MTETIGYYCDECRMKYVRHKCKDGLPCGHDKSEAVFVYCHYFAKSGEHVEMQWKDGKIDVWVTKKPKDRKVIYISRSAAELRGHLADDGEVEEDVADWLARQPARIIRAFLERWTSRKEPPTWRVIEQMGPEQPETPQ
jgi:hypothetical protein